MIAVFVSKDEKEFRKYVAGMPAKDKERFAIKYGSGVLWDSYTLSLSCNASTPVHLPKSVAGRAGGTNAANVNNDNSHLISYLSHVKKGDEDYNYVVICGSAIKDDTRDSDFDAKKVKDFLQAIKETVKRASFDKEGASDIRLFVHWGSGSDLINTYEKPFQGVCNQEASSVGFGKLLAYALSSRRSHLFDVSRITITLPKTYDELIELENRFKNAQLDAVFSKCAARIDSGIAEKREEIINRLDRFATCLLKSSLNTKKKKELLQVVAKAKDEKFENAKDTREETAAFMAKILNKEVFNG